MLGLGTIALPGAAHAQQKPPFDPAIDVQTFEYAVGPKTFFTVADGDVTPRSQVAVDALVTVLTKPFKIYNVAPDDPNKTAGTRTTVVSSMTEAQLTAAYGVNDRIQVGANLPIVFALSGDGLMPETGGPSPMGLSVTGLGDLVLEAKVRMLRTRALRLGAIGGVSLPTSIGSGGAQFIGDDLPTVRGKLVLQADAGRLSFGANAGFILRKPRTIYDSTIGQQLVWGVAAAARVTERISLIVEGYGRAGLPSLALDASPLEVEGGVRLYATGAVAVVAGVGTGLVKGIGSPEARGFVSLSYAPDVRDSDGDGVPNGRDKCPLVPEDRDGYQDDDGCPDDDNDGDHRPDAVDQCPNDAEDLDGFEDDDGCPELDNDKDGILDLQDKCPNDPEDGKPPFPKDGCPVGKGPSAEAAALPAPAPEIAAPAAACTQPDRDQDGIPDASDRCPDQPETVNGVNDDDGCPDTGGLTVARLNGDLLTVDRVPTLDGDALSRGGEIIVDQMALVMRGHTDVTRWLIAVGMPSETDAQHVAAAVRARLVERGVPTERIEILAAAGAARVGGLVKERGTAPPLCQAAAVSPTASPAPAAPAMPAAPAKPAKPAPRARRK